MKNLFTTIFTILFLSLVAQGQSSRIVEGDQLSNGQNMRNYVKNPSARKNTSGTAVSSATLVRDTDAADKINGYASYVCDASSQNGYCEWDTFAIQEGDKTGNCEASASYKGDGSLYKLQVWDGTSAISLTNTLPNVSDWTEIRANYPCGATRKVRLTQTESGTAPGVNIGRVQWSKATNVGSVIQSKYIGSLRYAGTTNCNWQISSTANAYTKASADTDCPSATVTGDLTAPGTKIIAFNAVLAAGTYKILMNTNIFQNASAFEVTCRMTTGSTTSSEWQYFNRDASTTDYAYNPYFILDLSADYTGTIELECKSNTSTAIQFVTQDTNSQLRFDVISYPNKAQQVVRMDQSNTNFAPWAITSPNNSWTGVTPASGRCNYKRDGKYMEFICLVNLTGAAASEARLSLPSGLTTSSIYTNRATECTALGPFSIDAAVNVYQVCAQSGVTYLNFAVSTNTGDRANANTLGNGDWSLNGRVAIEEWSESQNAPLLVGGVTSSYSGLTRSEWIKFGGSTVDNSNCTGSPCTIHRQSGAVTSVTRAGNGNYTVTFASGTFSDRPVCNVNGLAVGVAYVHGYAQDSSATSVNVRLQTTAADQDAMVWLNCFGPR